MCFVVLSVQCICLYLDFFSCIFWIVVLSCDGSRGGETRQNVSLKCRIAVCSNPLFCLISPRLTLGLVGYFQNITKEPVILGVATCEI